MKTKYTTVISTSDTDDEIKVSIVIYEKYDREEYNRPVDSKEIVFDKKNNRWEEEAEDYDLSEFEV